MVDFCELQVEMVLLSLDDALYFGSLINLQADALNFNSFLILLNSLF